MRSLALRNPEPSYRIGTWLFLRLLGVAHFFAFASFATQVEGLIGAEGILPAALYLQRVDAQLGASALWYVPTLFWWWSSDGALSGVCLLGAALAVALVVGFAERWTLIALWILYLSLCSVGRVFMGFQWDALLLETSVVALLVASPRLWCGLSGRPNPGRGAQFVLRLLVVKLLFSSGWVKLNSGDPHWADLTAMVYHYETQPLPTWIGWWAHQLPAGWHKLEAIGVFVIQLGLAPFALTRWRGWVFAPLVGLQILIALTGNYCFFNLLTVALCAVLLSDATWSKLWPAQDRPAHDGGANDDGRRGSRWPSRVASVVIALLVAVPLARSVAPAVVPEVLERANDALRPLRTFNAYGLFAVMTTDRIEIEVQGSVDGVDWQTYRLGAKPGPVDRAPGFIAPWQPRLDWQLWFAALGTVRNNPWFRALLARLLHGSAPVVALFEESPFRPEPPKFIRAARYRYRFTRLGDDVAGHWWRRERLDDYFPPVSLSGRLSPRP